MFTVTPLVLPSGSQWLGAGLCCLGVCLVMVYTAYATLKRNFHGGRHRR